MHSSKPAQKKRPVKYGGKLDEPIVLPPANTLAALLQGSLGGEKENTDYLVTQFMTKLDLLLDHYGIKRTEGGAHWHSLAFRLALDHVKGFQVQDHPKRGPGRPSWTTKDDNFGLAKDIETQCLLRGVEHGEACRLLLLKRKGRWKGVSKKALMERYRRHRMMFKDTPKTRIASLKTQFENFKPLLLKSLRGEMDETARERVRIEWDFNLEPPVKTALVGWQARHENNI